MEVNKYVLTDGTVVCLQPKQKHSEENNFTIKYCQDYEGNEIIDYCGDGSDFNLDEFIKNVNAFKIIEGLKNWNKYLEEEFTKTDDDVYYHYMMPVVKEKNCNKWHCYDFEGSVEIFDNNYIATLEEYVEDLKTIQKRLY